MKRKARQLAALKSAFAHPAVSPRVYRKQKHGIVNEYSLLDLFQQSTDTIQPLMHVFACSISSKSQGTQFTCYWEKMQENLSHKK